jgi:hypothetical protein
MQKPFVLYVEKALSPHASSNFQAYNNLQKKDLQKSSLAFNGV